MNKLTEIANEIIGEINKRMTEEELDETERVMLLSYINENCRGFVESVTARVYHNVRYRHEVDE